MNGRVQDAVTGVFLSADPYVTDPGLTQNYHRYGYVYNNPLTFTDPSGFCVDGYTHDAEHDLNGRCIRATDQDPTLDQILVQAWQWILGAARILDPPEEVNTCQSPSGPYLSRSPCPASDEGNTDNGNHGPTNSANAPVAEKGPLSRWWNHLVARNSTSPNSCGQNGGARYPNAVAGVSIESACQTHDNCYDSLGARKVACDLGLARDIVLAYLSQGIEGHNKTTSLAIGLGVAADYFIGVTYGGLEAYRNGQTPNSYALRPSEWQYLRSHGFP